MTRRRRAVLVAASVALLVAVAAVAAAAVPGLTAEGQSTADTGTGSIRTAAVVQTDLTRSTTYTGQLAITDSKTLTNQRASGGEAGVVVQMPAADATAVSGGPGESPAIAGVALAQTDPTDPSTTTTTEPEASTTTEPATTTTEPATTTTEPAPTTEPATTTTTEPATTTTTVPAPTTTAPECPTDDRPTDSTAPDPAATTTVVDNATTTTTVVPSEPDCPPDTTVPEQPTTPVSPGRGGAPAAAAPAAAAAEPAGGGSGAGGDQTVTWIAAPGETLEHGDVAFSVDGTPTIVLFGDVPAWRDLSVDSDDGADVVQLEAGLVMLGFASADDLAIDQHFDGDTEAAVEAFQEAYSFEVDGTLELGDVMFLSGPVTVTASEVALGDAVGAGSAMLSVASPGRSVTLPVEVTAAALLTEGTGVDVEVGDVTVAGTVTAVGKDGVAGADGDESTVDVTVELVDPGAVAVVPDGAEATISVTNEAHPGVLAVPAGALRESVDGGVEVLVVQPDGTLAAVPVTPGFTAGGLVEIVAGDLAAGDHVALT